MKYLLSLILLSACGSQQQPQGNEAPSIPDLKEESALEEGAESTEGFSRNDLFIGAQLVEAKAEMPTCELANQKSLIYVVETESFYYCAKDFSWAFIDLKGPKGEKGADGLKGDKGDQGISGRDGKDGKDGRDGLQGLQGVAGANGQNGENGRDGSLQVWVHPVTQTRWFLGTFFNGSSLTSSDASLCPSNSDSPTEEEFKDAVLSGLTNQFGSSLAAATITGETPVKYYVIGRAPGSSDWTYDFKVGNPASGAVSRWTLNSAIYQKVIYSLCMSN